MIPQFTLLSGTINGANLVFTTPTPYTAGTTAVYLNGQLLLHPDGAPWTETDPSTGVITLDGACHIPRVGDVLAAFYLDTQDQFTGTVVRPITGSLKVTSLLGGTLEVTQPLSAGLSQVSTLSGQLATSANISANITTEKQLSAIIQKC